MAVISAEVTAEPPPLMPQVLHRVASRQVAPSRRNTPSSKNARVAFAPLGRSKLSLDVVAALDGGVGVQTGAGGGGGVHSLYPILSIISRFNIIFGGRFTFNLIQGRKRKKYKGKTQKSLLGKKLSLLKLYFLKSFAY